MTEQQLLSVQKSLQPIITFSVEGEALAVNLTEDELSDLAQIIPIAVPKLCYELRELAPLTGMPYVREAAKVGRNDPCPCGSGKKYKKCCLN